MTEQTVSSVQAESLPSGQARAAAANASRIESMRLHPNWQEDDHLLAILASNAKRHPNQVAVRERDHGVWQEYTWEQYLDTVLALAAAMESRGVGPEDIILVIGDNRPALYFSMLAAVALRAIPSPAYPDTQPEELASQIQREHIRFAVAEDQEQVDKLLQVRDDHACQLDLIIFDDPRGLQDTTGLVAFNTLVEEGRERLKAEPALRDSLISRPSVHDVAALLHSS